MSQNPTIEKSTKIEAGSGKGSFSREITGLTPSTVYYVRAYCTNEAGTAYGETKRVQTYTAATVKTTDAINITTTSATVGGEVTDDGGDEVTERGIVWSKSANPMLESGTKVGCGKGEGKFTADLSSLEIYTKYYFRAYAINSTGTSYGAEKGFTTLAQKVTGVTLNSTTLSMKEGESRQLVATVLPNNATDKKVKWESDNSSVVSTDQNGKISALSAGTATVTVTTNDGNHTASCTVTVTDKYVNLSTAGTANCYIVTSAGDYKFNGTVKGGSTIPLDGTASTAEVLWESYGTEVTPSVGSIVKDVSYKDEW